MSAGCTSVRAELISTVKAGVSQASSSGGVQRHSAWTPGTAGPPGMHARAVPHATAVQVFEDSFHQLRHKDMRGKLVVHFQNEEGIDAGGVSREWFQVFPPP